jgi:hypothetical protein
LLSLTHFRAQTETEKENDNGGRREKKDPPTTEEEEYKEGRRRLVIFSIIISLYTVKFVFSSSSLHSKSSLLYCKIFFYYEIFLFVSCVMNIDYFTKSRDLFLSLFVGLRVKQRSLFLYSLLNLPISLIIKNMMMLMRGMVTFEGNGVCCCCCSLFHFY